LEIQMSIISKLFGGVNQPQQAAAAPNAAPQTPALPGNIPQNNNNPASAGNPTVPAASISAVADQSTTTTAPQGLDKFNDLFVLSEADKAQLQAPESPFAKVTPEAIQQVAGNTDFSKVVTPELMAKISAGGEEATAAMITAMNLVAQQGYAQSATASMKLIDTALAKQREQFQAELPNLIKSQTVTESLRNSNPIFNHPAAAPMLDTLQKQIQIKNPTATADQIRKQAEDYLLNFATAANPNAANASNGNAGGPATPKLEDFSLWG
jgi:hypothetical protein